MSDAATLSKALGWMLALGALAGCGESIPVDIFASKVAGKGECSAVDCQSIEDGRGAGSGGANTADAKPNEDARVGETPPKTTSAAGGASGGDRVDPGTGGSNAGTGRAGGGEAGSAGSSGGTDDGGATDDGGTVMTDAGQAFDGAPP